MRNVLVVDDDRRLVALLRSYLAEHACETCAAYSVAEALQQVRQNAPDILLLDVMMSDGAGYQVSRALRSDPAVSRTAIIFETSLDDESAVQYALRQGGDAFLAKPFSLAQLLYQITRMENLLRELKSLHPPTGLPRAASMLREVQHRLAKEGSFALVHIRLAEIPDGGHANAVQQREMRVKSVAQCLYRIIEDEAFSKAHICYVEPHAYIVLLQPEQHMRFVDLAVCALGDSLSALATLVVPGRERPSAKASQAFVAQLQPVSDELGTELLDHLVRIL